MAKPLEVNKADSSTADFPQLTKAGVQIQSSISESVPVPPVFTPSKPASLSEDVPLSTVAPPKASESLSGPEKAPEASPLAEQK